MLQTSSPTKASLALSKKMISATSVHSKDMSVTLEHDELRNRSENTQKERDRRHTGVFRAKDEVESVSGLLDESDMSDHISATNASAMSKERKMKGDESPD